MKSLTTSAGTVSRILWHFTGGPAWNREKKKQNKNPKHPDQAYNNLISILQSKEFRLGQYTEVVQLTIPERYELNFETGGVDYQKNAPVEITSAPVCCLTDIPIAHLSYHASRYGKFAIGFHRTAVVEHGFNPVFYTLQHTEVIRAIHEGFKHLKSIENYRINWAFDDIEKSLPEIELEKPDVSSAISTIRSETDSIIRHVKSAQEGFEEFLAFIKTFVKEEFSTIYCEREWRSLKAYSFTYDDVAMIVIPKGTNRGKFFNKFINHDVDILKLPRSIPVVAWEDLVEH